MVDSLNPELPILLVDDEELMLRSMSAILCSNGFSNIITISDSRKVLPALAAHKVSFVLLDLVMPHVSGQELLEEMRQSHPEVPVVVATALTDVETAVGCMKMGAFDYIVKPIEEGRLIAATRHALEVLGLRRENELLRETLCSAELKHPEAFSAILTNNRKMLSVFHYVEAISGTSQPVLVTGETGVGKELIARAIHELSGRPGRYVPVNVAGLDDTIFADTLFGHLRGAYTGATGKRSGLIARAAAGTLILDEIGDLSPSSQVKLLRLLQEREYMPLGADVPSRSDARIVVATNKKLAELRESEQFRKDLFYRLCSHHVHIPPLRDRPDDLPLLVDYFLEEAAGEMDKHKPAVPGEIYSLLGAYHFPGNIRELRALIFDAVSRHVSGILSLDSFAGLFPSSEHPRTGISEPLQFGDRLPTLKEIRTILISEAMRRAENNQSVAARLLGITRQGLNKHLKKAEKN